VGLVGVVGSQDAARKDGLVVLEGGLNDLRGRSDPESSQKGSVAVLGEGAKDQVVFSEFQIFGVLKELIRNKSGSEDDDGFSILHSDSFSQLAFFSELILNKIDGTLRTFSRSS
jgi:hypothetical protein